ncbi:uncharacterized, partial [Tachysurus ichikawai]
MASSMARANARRSDHGALLVSGGVVLLAVVVWAILTVEVHHEAEAEDEEGVSVCCFDSCSETVRVSFPDVTTPRLRLERGSALDEKGG